MAAVKLTKYFIWSFDKRTRQDFEYTTTRTAVVIFYLRPGRPVGQPAQKTTCVIRVAAFKWQISLAVQNWRYPYLVDHMSGFMLIKSTPHIIIKTTTTTTAVQEMPQQSIRECCNRCKIILGLIDRSIQIFRIASLIQSCRTAGWGRKSGKQFYYYNLSHRVCVAAFSGGAASNKLHAERDACER